MVKIMSIFEKWNKEMNVEELKKDIKQVEKQTQANEYKEVEVGSYEVKIDKMSIKECQSQRHFGEPMFFVQFRILDGEFKNKCVFMNQLITEPWQLDIVINFLYSLKVKDFVEFRDYAQFNNLICEIKDEIDDKLEFLLDYGKNNRGFNTFRISEVYEI